MARSRALFLGGATLLLAAGLYLAFTYPIRMPAAAWLTEHPFAAVGLAGVTGFADGLNPCAITTLLLFVGALLALVESATHTGSRILCSAISPRRDRATS